jgi:hypothetical protein
MIFRRIMGSLTRENTGDTITKEFFAFLKGENPLICNGREDRYETEWNARSVAAPGCGFLHVPAACGGIGQRGDFCGGRRL